ncbi:hypothetical protein BS50DRAFT_675278 [Corynespora cassiicola Philippines]|uniref:Uncharacterized protein n=1 Tax=Corynespora cassiicola Philippines TaxID=1448308 RepID=A0A2T2NUJ4_CORCC|nr:hypothetical protein BS50DRAFT_675278 [Corynespora cassiicola Philippines]
MFVPRVLRLKRPHESPECDHNGTHVPMERPADGPEKDVVRVAGFDNATRIHAQDAQLSASGMSSDYLAQVAVGIELLFTDFALQDEKNAAWLASLYRVVEGEMNFVHLSNFVHHPSLATIDPAVTQKSLQQAIKEYGSKYLEMSRDTYYVRRSPNTYPLPFIPANAISVVNEKGLDFWSERTIYVETHARSKKWAKCAPKIAQWLQSHGELRNKWLPIQTVRILDSGGALITLSGNVTHQDIWQKWAKKGKPNGWTLMTKIEYDRRTKEHIKVRQGERSRGSLEKSKRKSEHSQSLSSCDERKKLKSGSDATYSC